jgi:hypothetical protein
MTTNNPADVYGESLDIGDKVRVLNGNFAFASGIVEYLTGTDAWIAMRVHGRRFTYGFPLNNLVRVR